MSLQIINGDSRAVLKNLPDKSVQCCVTSPPFFGLRDYGVKNQIGLEATPGKYVNELVDVFREVRRALSKDGVMFLNLGDSYNAYNGNRGPAKGVNKNAHEALPKLPTGHGLTAKDLKPKDLIGIPWMMAFALRNDGWYLRSDIIWSKPNAMPESVTDRPTKSHEYLFLLTKSAKYYYDAAAIAEPSSLEGDARRERADLREKDGWADAYHGNPPTGLARPKKDKQRGHSRRHAGFNDRWDAMEKTEQCSGTRNKRSVWTVPTAVFNGSHFATFPPNLIKPCILAGCPVGGTVLDPFAGSGTTGMVALELGRSAILIELNPDYVRMAQERTNVTPGLAI